MKRLLLLAALAIWAGPCWAQAGNDGETGLEEIIVTGSRMLDWEPDIIPAIKLVKRADFMIQKIRIVNDTRKEDQRADEIYETIFAMLAAAKKSSTFTLGTGEDVFVALTEENYKLPLLNLASKADTSYTDLLVKAPLTRQSKANKIVDEIRDFIKKAKLVGRSEVLPTGEIGLSIIQPEKYRQEVIGLIAKDVKQTLAAFGDGYSVQLEGMEYPLLWERQGLATMALYIPYKYTILPGGN